MQSVGGRIRHEPGVALIVVLMAMSLMSALGVALMLSFMS